MQINTIELLMYGRSSPHPDVLRHPAGRVVPYTGYYKVRLLYAQILCMCVWTSNGFQKSSVAAETEITRLPRRCAPLAPSRRESRKCYTAVALGCTPSATMTASCVQPRTQELLLPRQYTMSTKWIEPPTSPISPPCKQALRSRQVRYSRERTVLHTSIA